MEQEGGGNSTALDRKETEDKDGAQRGQLGD